MTEHTACATCPAYTALGRAQLEPRPSTHRPGSGRPGSGGGDEVSATPATLLIPSATDPLVEAMARTASIELGASVAEVLGSRGRQHVSAARHAIWYVLLEAGWSYTRLAAAFDRNHTTILHGVERTRLRLRVDRECIGLVEQLRRTQRDYVARLRDEGLHDSARASINAMDRELARARALVNELNGRIAHLTAARDVFAELMTPVPTRVQERHIA